METSKERIQKIIEDLATLTSSKDPGVTRFSYSEDDQKARKYLISIFKELGLKVRIDAVGNIFARLEGRDPSLPPILSGSHIDSVKKGGRFDGIVGSVGALESVRVMVENNYVPRHPIEVVLFAEEEGSNFQVPVMGSKVLVGELTLNDLKDIKNAEGTSAYEVIKSAGFNPDHVQSDTLKKGDVKAMLELHIEQSVRLDREQYPIGIINGIAGLKWYKISFYGEQNHAGATPMNLRKDPMVSAAEVIAAVHRMASETNDTAVATVGHLEVTPNIPNAIPARVSFIVDIRDISEEGIDKVVGKLLKTVKEVSNNNKTPYQAECIATSEVIHIKPYIIEAMESSARDLKLDYILMPSGAVHDSNYMAEITDVGMIFVPSINGRSHVSDENTDFEHIKLGADLLLKTLILLAS